MDNELVSEFAQVVLDQAAPEELAIFEETAAEYFRDPDGTLSAKHRDEALGFGVDLALLTPYVLAVAGPVVTFLLSTVAESAKNEARPVIADLVRRLFRRPADPQPGGVPPLTPQQAAEVRRLAREKAVNSGLPEDRATLLADAVVGGLYVTA